MMRQQSAAERRLIERNIQGLRDEAARRRLAGEVPAAYRGRNWGVSRRQALLVGTGLVLLVMLLLRSWGEFAAAVADAPSQHEVTLVTE